MRTRAILGFLVSALAVDMAAGCQIIAQLDVLQVGGSGGTTTTSSTGGASSTSSTTSSSTSSTSSSTGSATSSSTTSSSSSSTTSSSSSSTTSSSSSSTTSSSGFVCGLDAGMCVVSDAGTGMGCPVCMGNVCQPPCNSQMPCTLQSTNILTMAGPLAIQCTDQTCKGVSFTCEGSNLCEVDCSGQNSCQGMTLTCGSGPCRLRCDMMACSNTTIACGSDACDVTYYGPPPDGGPLPDGGLPPTDGGPPGLPVNQLNCDASCDCTSKNLGAP